MLKTKLRIAEALLELMDNNDLHEIQIEEIADIALLSSRTIRRHFKGKESILVFYIKYLNSSLDFSDVDSVLSATMKYVSFWKQEEALVNLLRRQNLLHLFVISNMEYSKEAISAIFDHLFHSGEYQESKDYLLDLIVQMETSLFYTWITNDYEFDIETSSQKISHAIQLFKKVETRNH